jgi:hypothetical protein
LPPYQLGDRLATLFRYVTDWVRGNIAELSVASSSPCIVYLLLSWLKRRAATACAGKRG